MKPAIAAFLFVALAACMSPFPPPAALDTLGPMSLTHAPTAPQEPTSSPSPQEAAGKKKEWSFLIQPYVLFANIDGDASIGRATLPDIGVDFGDVLDNLELGGMIHAEVYHPSGWGAIVDYAFMDLGDDISGPVGIVTGADVFQGVFEAFASHRFETEPATVDVYAGIRWWDIDIDLNLSVGSGRRSRDVDWVDPVVGAKARFPLGDRWAWLVRGDVGGFGVESDFSWAAATGFLYRFSQLFSIELQYRAIGVDYQEGVRGSRDFFSYDTITHGPQLGFSFEF